MTLTLPSPPRSSLSSLAQAPRTDTSEMRVESQQDGTCERVDKTEVPYLPSMSKFAMYLDFT